MAGKSVRRGAIATGVLTAGLVLAACGGGGSSTTTTTSRASGVIGQIKSIANSAKQAKTTTFEATWTSTTSSKVSTITLAQDGTKSMFKVDKALIVNDGKTTYFCSSGTTCLKSSMMNPLHGVIGIYNGEVFLNTISSYTSSAILRAAGVNLTFDDQTWGGIASSCVNIAHSGKTATWCVAKDSGILTYWSADGSSFTITHYPANPRASDFTLPAGAHVVTL